MADYNGTDDDDIIDASELASDINNIYPGKGNDTITNAKSGQTIISSPGEDNISGSNFAYALWQATEGGITINLKEGWSDDGFGGKDLLIGVSTVHGSGFGDTLYGTSSNETFFANGGNNTIDGGGGEDSLNYFGRGSSDNFIITYINDEIHIKGPNNTIDIAKNIKYVKFFDDDKTFDLSYISSPLKANLMSKVYTFFDDTIAPEYTYAGVTTEAKILSWFPQGGSLIDLNQDGIKDVIIPMSKGYASGVDGSTPFIALTSSNGTLIYDQEINNDMPNITSSRRSELIKLANSDTLSLISVNHDTEEETKRTDPDRKIPFSELTIIQTTGSTTKLSDIMPKLPIGTDLQPFAVDAHSMAVGDINGDGLDDIFVGEMSSPPYALIQQDDGSFIIIKNTFYENLKNIDEDYTTLLLDAALVDVNGDGFDDLIAGFGHGDESSKVYINNNGNFDKNSFKELPDSIYGSASQLHMKTLPSDFDHDGDIDLAIQWSRIEPYYGGQYIQILKNDGNGNYTDTTNTTDTKSLEDAYTARLQWSEPWQQIDLNNDGHMDIAGANAIWIGASNKKPLFYLNDGKGNFEIHDVAADVVNGMPVAFFDTNNNNKIEFITFKTTLLSEVSSELSFYLYELSEEIGTGPNFSITSAEQGAPGFNERYYLNENSSAQEAVTDGTYETGLAHYLTKGKDAGLKTFAPFTKVHGYSGNDTIILRDGDEIAYGYAGNDSIEGGAGNDSIDGGAGSDTAIFKDASSAFTITTNDNGSISVTHSSPSDELIDEGSDTLISIEKIQFSDKTISSISLKYTLSDTIDTTKNILKSYSTETQSGTQNFNAGDNIIVADGQAKTLRGLDGDDTYFISNLLPEESSITIIDTSGTNTIQIPGNTAVTKSQWAKDTVRLTFEDARVITVNNADTFSYNLGGNVNDGTVGTNVTFSELAEIFGISDILSLAGNDTGSIVDMYII